MDIGRSTLSLIFPLVAGAVADLYGLSYTFYLFGGITLIAALVMLSVPQRTQGRGHRKDEISK